MTNNTNDGRMRRKRGGQPGNRNGSKLGFYSAVFRADEIENLEAAMAAGLQDEIEALRVIMWRALKESRDLQGPDETMNLLDHMGLSAVRLAALLRTQKMLGDEGDQVSLAITEALSGLVDEIQKEGRRVNKP